MGLERLVVTVPTNGSAVGEGFTPVLSGRLSSIQYVKTDYADTADFTITSEATGEVLWQESNVTASKIVRPRAATHSTAGAAALYAAGGSAVLDKIALVLDRIKIAIAEGGNAKTGTFVIVME